MILGDLDPLLLRNFAIALFIGALVGVDREHHAANSPSFGGLRTFMLIALVGGASTWLGGVLGQPWLMPVGLVGLTVLLATSYGTAPSQGLTSEVAALAVYLLGAAAVAGRAEVAVVLGIAVTALLAFRAPLHDIAGRIAYDDLVAGLKLLFATFIVLPLLPNHPIDPLGALVPFRLWWLVVLISSLSLTGYAAVRWLGPQRGLALTGVFGGLVSSTAVTLSSARQSKEPGASADILAMSVVLAWAVMCVRVVVEVAVVNPSLVQIVAPPLVGMAVAAVAAAAFLGTRPHVAQATLGVELRNPFSLWEAMKFALLFAAVLVGVELGRRYLAPTALYAVAALAGTTDVDAITLSMADLANGELADATAAIAIVVAAAANTLVKCTMAFATGTRPFAARVAAATALVVIAGAVGVAIVASG